MNDDLDTADAIDEELTSYLDGELAASERAEVEERLARDEAFRERLRSLQQTWDALDLLPKSPAGSEFTTSTMEVVATELVAETQQFERVVHSRRSYRKLGLALAAVAAAVIGYVAVQYRLSAPNRELVRDLPTIERVEQLHNTPSLEFLEELRKQNLFSEDHNESS